MQYDGKLDDYLARFTPAEVDRILSARVWATELHEGSFRASGEPTVTHPERVATVLAGMGMDADSVIAGLLHQAIEDGKTKRPGVESHAGERVGLLVEEMSRMASLKAKNKTIKAAETIRKMLLSMTRDLRVIIIKLADKLDNMRTLKWLPEEDRRRIAAECVDVFAPLADRLGISWLKDELEDLALKEINREAYDQIKLLVSAKKPEREAFLVRAREEIEEAAKADGMDVEVMARAKHFYSIYQKMRKRAKGSDELFDLFGVRILCDEETDCYAVLGLVHGLWKPIDGRFKDYIAMPKSNGYRSLHTTVMAWDGTLLEIQIRTREMHRIAEFGVASHWLYKKGAGVDAVRPEELAIVNRLKDWGSLLDAGSDFLEDIKREILKDSIIVFTPKGDAIELPSGSTALDFAYAIHSDVGNRCLAAKADGALKDGQKLWRGGTKLEIKGNYTEIQQQAIKGDLATIGRHKAVASFAGGRIQIAGYFAWFTWLFVHIAYLIGFRNRISVLLQWAYNYIFFERGVRLITETEDASMSRHPATIGRTAEFERMRSAAGEGSKQP